VRAIHTPGHRPEHTSFALVDTARGAEPWAVLTGDSLFVGDIARPDLAVDKVDGARAIFHSLHHKLLSLPDDTEVWPAHLGGSLCGGPGMDMKISSTVGYEAAHNALLREGDEGRFVERAIAKLAPQPPNFKAIVSINRGPLDRRTIEAVPLTPRQVQENVDDGTLIVDVRTAEQFDDAHVRGSVAITILQAGFGSKLAWVADRDRDIVVVGRDDEDARRAIQLGAAVGLRNFGGFLSGGMTAWRQDKLPTRRIERLRVDEARARRETGDLQVLDVRELSEWDAGHVAGSIHTPYHDLHALPDAVDPERPVAAICASGQRAATAASLLERHGAHHVIHVVDGGVPAWLRDHPDDRGG
jgi:rhodanese-related sulfurtransferase